MNRELFKTNPSDRNFLPCGKRNAAHLGVVHHSCVLDEVAGQRLLSPARLHRLSGKTAPWVAVIAEHNKRVEAASDCWRLIYWIEIPLRNALHTALEGEFGPSYWKTKAFEVRAGRQIVDAMNKATNEAENDHQFPADLTFGTWVKLLSPRVSRHLWDQCLNRAFLPHAEAVVLFEGLVELKSIRNAIAHHELSAKITPEQVYQLCIAIAEQMDDDLVDYLRELFG